MMKQFEDSLETSVFTTKYVIENNSPILFVYHDEDGDWQFHGAEDLASEDDMRVIALGEIIDIDNTVLEIADLPLGFEAIRKTTHDGWKIISPN